MKGRNFKQVLVLRPDSWRFPSPGYWKMGQYLMELMIPFNKRHKAGRKPIRQGRSLGSSGMGHRTDRPPSAPAPRQRLPSRPWRTRLLPGSHDELASQLLEWRVQRARKRAWRTTWVCWRTGLRIPGRLWKNVKKLKRAAVVAAATWPVFRAIAETGAGGKGGNRLENMSLLENPDPKAMLLPPCPGWASCLTLGYHRGGSRGQEEGEGLWETPATATSCQVPSW